MPTRVTGLTAEPRCDPSLSRGTQTPVHGKLIDPILSRGDFVFHKGDGR